MQNPFGTSPVVAIIQSQIVGSSFVVKVAYGGSIVRLATGAYIATLDGGNQTMTSSATNDINVNGIMWQTMQYGGTPLQVSLSWGSPGSNQAEIVFVNGLGSIVDPPGLWNLVAFQCNDGVNSTP